MDIAEQFKSLCLESLRKNAINSDNTIMRSICNGSNKDTVIQLPIDIQPFAKNYLRHAFPLSVIQANNREKANRIIINDYIDIIYKPIYGWFDYHNYYYSQWECIDCNKISKELLMINKINIIGFIINALNIGYYSDIWLDIYYIPGKSEYKKMHKSHGLLIYGADLKERLFFVLSYSNKDQYEPFKVPMDSICLLYTSRCV